MDTKRQSKVRVKQERAIKLRANGLSIKDVKDQLNKEFGTTHSYDYVKKMLAKILRENAPEGVEELRNLEGMRLDNMLARVTADFYRPTPQLLAELDENGERQLVSLDFEREDQIMRTRAKLAETMLRIQDRRAKLYALDAPPAEAAPVDVQVIFDRNVAPVPMTEAVVDIPRESK